MSHSLCALLHWLASCPGAEFQQIETPSLAGSVAEAIRLGYVENPKDARVCDLLWVRLTDKGRELVLESLNAMEAVS